ncbi:18890_t:CDS:2, partial [Acaulospora morrowiae]
ALGKERDQTMRWVEERAQAAKKNKHKIIVLGDFNSIPNPRLDKTTQAKHQSKSNNPTSRILKYLQYNGYIDTFREVHPCQERYTWRNSRNTETRIDQIWMSSDEEWNLVEAYIAESEAITHSDHEIAGCQIEVGDIVNKDKQTLNKATAIAKKYLSGKIDAESTARQVSEWIKVNAQTAKLLSTELTDTPKGISL